VEVEDPRFFDRLFPRGGFLPDGHGSSLQTTIYSFGGWFVWMWRGGLIFVFAMHALLRGFSYGIGVGLLQLLFKSKFLRCAGAFAQNGVCLLSPRGN